MNLNNNKFYRFPVNKNIGCIGIILGLLVISILLIIFFFIGIWVLGFIALFYMYRFLKGKFKNNVYNKTDNSNTKDNVTEAEYIDVSRDSDENKD
jgi:uncharacterized membrane protein